MNIVFTLLIATSTTGLSLVLFLLLLDAVREHWGSEKAVAVALLISVTVTTALVAAFLS